MKLQLNKRIISNLLCVSTLFCLVSSANAELQSRLNGQAVYDTDLDITWLADANAGGRLSFSNAKQWVSDLSVDGVMGWRLPDGRTTFDGTNHSLSELGHLFHKELGADSLPYPPNIFDSTDPDLALFSNITRNYYWATDNDNNLAIAYSFSRGYRVQTYRTYRRYGVWAVHDGDVENLTVPCTVNCITINSIRLFHNGLHDSRSRITARVLPSVQGSLLRLVWTLPDNSIIEQFNNGRGVRGYRPSILTSGQYGQFKLTVTDATKTGYTFDPAGSLTLSQTFTLNPPNPNNGIISGYVWTDENGNGIDDNEPRPENIPVYLTDCNGTVLRTLSTIYRGNYNFSKLAAGNYKVQIDAPAGTHFSPKQSGINKGFDSDINPLSGTTDCLSLTQNQQRLNIGAGFVPDIAQTDNLSISSATYKKGKNKLKIKATSDAPQGSAVITVFSVTNGVEVELGILKWKAKKSYYKGTFKRVWIAPDSIILRSNKGGSVTGAVTIK